MKARFGFIFLFSVWFSANAQSQTLELSTCFDSAQTHMPLLRQQALLNAQLENKIANYNKIYLPTLIVNGQATYQSQVPELPFSLPIIPSLDLPKFQYRSYLEIYQPIYDAGLSKALKHTETTQNDVLGKALNLANSEYKKQIAQLYFHMLLTQEQTSILEQTKALILKKESVVKVAIDKGVAQENDLLRIQAEVLEIEKTLNALTKAKESGMELLELLTGINTNNRTLTRPKFDFPVPEDLSLNPNLQLINTKQIAVMANKEVLQSQRIPKITAFGQVGMGAPNPYNFFEKDLASYYMGGVKVSWTITDWGTTHREKTNLLLKYQILEEQKNQQTIEISSKMIRLQAEHETLKYALENDIQVKSLRERIRKNAALQLDEGIITSGTYLTEVLAAQTAEIQVLMDEINLLQNNVLLQFEKGTIY
jgi:outer membrane protein TolC